MAKVIIAGILLIAVISGLLYAATRQPTIINTTPVDIPKEELTPTPKAPEPNRGLPTPKAIEEEPTPPGIDFEKIFPPTINFWVNEIQVPATTLYEGQQFIPIKENDIKTFAGSFGPYFEDPRAFVNVKLCSELKGVNVGPVCETVPVIFKEKYVSFAKGYQYDEFIGAFASKDYVAWFDVYVGQTRVATSNKAVIRTVRA